MIFLICVLFKIISQLVFSIKNQGAEVDKIYVLSFWHFFFLVCQRERNHSVVGPYCNLFSSISCFGIWSTYIHIAGIFFKQTKSKTGTIESTMWAPGTLTSTSPAGPDTFFPNLLEASWYLDMLCMNLAKAHAWLAAIQIPAPRAWKIHQACVCMPKILTR